MLKKVVFGLGIILVLLILGGLGMLGIITIYDKQESYCSERSEKILGDRYGDFVVPTKQEIEEFKLDDELNANGAVGLSYLEFLKCTKESNIFILIQNKELMEQKIF